MKADEEYRAKRDDLDRELRLLALALLDDGLSTEEFRTAFNGQLAVASPSIFLIGKRLAARNPQAVIRYADQSVIDRFLEQQARYVNGFARDIHPAYGKYDLSEPQTAKRVEWRAGLYADAMEGLVNLGIRQADPLALCRWVLGRAEHCGDCIYEDSLGVRPIMTLWRMPGTGQTACGTHCRCHLEVLLSGGATRVVGPHN